MPGSFRSFAVIPAAGASRRMERPKLLLPLRGRTVLEQVLAAWQASRVERIVLVVTPELPRLAELARNLGVDVVLPPRAPDQMKDTVRLGLAHLRETYAPQATDAWLLAPADMPRLSPRTIDCLLRAYDPARPATLVPVSSGRRGHPVLFPFRRAGDVEALAADQGMNTLVEAGPTVEIPVPDGGICEDLDTPEDYRRLLD